jgi:hypothetical protein
MEVLIENKINTEVEIKLKMEDEINTKVVDEHNLIRNALKQYPDEIYKDLNDKTNSAFLEFGVNHFILSHFQDILIPDFIFRKGEDYELDSLFKVESNLILPEFYRHINELLKNENLDNFSYNKIIYF